MRGITYYQNEKIILDRELASLLATRPDDPKAITHKRGEILANLKKQYKIQKDIGNIGAQNNLKVEIGSVTTDHKNQLNVRKAELKRNPNYKISEDYVLSAKKVTADFRRLRHSVPTDKPYNAIEFGKSSSALFVKTIGLGAGVTGRAILNVLMLGGYYSWAATHYIWNGSRALQFDKTKQGKMIKKGQDFAKIVQYFFAGKYVK